MLEEHIDTGSEHHLGTDLKSLTVPMVVLTLCLMAFFSVYFVCFNWRDAMTRLKTELLSKKRPQLVIGLYRQPYQTYLNYITLKLP